MKNSIKSISYVASSGVACLAGNAALAQVQPDAGTLLRELAPPALTIPQRVVPPVKVDEPVRPAMKPDATRILLKQLRVTGSTVIGAAELELLVRDVPGKEVGFADLDAAAARITKHYRDRGYMVARAYLPAQDIRDGVVEIAVLEGRYGKVLLDNRSRVRDGSLRGILEPDVAAGLPVHGANLERKILLMHDLAGVQEARSMLRPGTRVGDADLSLEIIAAPLFSGSVEIDNHGNRFTGANRVSAQVNAASPMGLGDHLSLRAAKSINGMDYGRFAYTVPVGGSGARVGMSFSASNYELIGQNFASSGVNGDSRNWTANASYPVVRGTDRNLYLQLAHDWRSFEDRTFTTGIVNEKRTRVATVTMSGDVRDGFLGGAINVYSVSVHAGNVDIRSPAQLTADAASARTQGRFTKMSFNALRLQTLNEFLQLYAAIAGQKAGKNLDSSEKFILGGVQGVRAYPQGQTTGDSGVLGTLELRATTKVPHLPGVVQPFVFVDAGHVTVNAQPFAVATNTQRLSGAGLGVTWSRANDFQVKLMVAGRTGRQVSNASDTDRHVRGWLQIIKQF